MNYVPNWRAQAERRLRLMKEIRRRECRANFLAFCIDALQPLGLTPAPHHRLLIDELEQIARGENDRLLVTMPPGSAKSTYSSILFPAWLLARKPGTSIIGASHTADLAESFSRRTMGIVRDQSALLGMDLVTEAVAGWQTSNGGFYKSAGVGGPITGRRADCLPGDTIISTEIGPVALVDFVNLLQKPRILSYNISTHGLEYKSVLAWREKTVNELVEVRTQSGFVLRSTPEHKHYVAGRGYTPAHCLSAGDRLIATSSGQDIQERLHRLWADLFWYQRDMPTMLQRNARQPSRTYLSAMWQALFVDASGDFQEGKGWFSRNLLRARVQRCRTVGRKKSLVVHGVRRQVPQGARALPGVLPQPRHCQGSDGSVHSMRMPIWHQGSGVCQKIKEGHDNPILWTEVLSCLAYRASDMRNMQPASGKKHKSILFKGMSAFALASTYAGRSDVRHVRCDVSPEKLSPAVLRTILCRCSTCRPYVWCRKLSLRRTAGLQQPVQKNAPLYSRTGRVLSWMWPQGRNDRSCRKGQEAKHNSYPPHQRRPDDQRAQKSCSFMQELPSQTPQSEFVSVVERLRGESVRVYDIQVEDNHNFFANGILTSNCAIIDDPVKSREDADSERFRDRAWGWFSADLRTRLKPNGRIVVIMTRWHEDDLGGRLLLQQGHLWRQLKLPAIAGEDDPLQRAPGEWLWDSDDHYGYGAELRKVHDEYVANGAMRDWGALFQQDPRPSDGGVFKTHLISTLEAAPAGGNVVRAWDLAATEQFGTRDPDWTVGVKMMRTQDGGFVVLDVIRFRGGPDDVERAIVNTAAQDGRHCRIGIAQDPGQAGKQQILYLTRKLSGYRVESSPETGDKSTRAAPVASQVNVGNVSMVKAKWNAAFIDELGSFPSGSKDDQVDALSRAFSMVGLRPPPIRISPEFLARV